MELVQISKERIRNFLEMPDVEVQTIEHSRKRGKGEFIVKYDYSNAPVHLMPGEKLQLLD